MKEQALVVGDVAAHLLDGVPLCGAKSSAFLTGMCLGRGELGRRGERTSGSNQTNKKQNKKL